MAAGGLELDDAAARELAAMQFAGGLSIAQIAARSERDEVWVEESIRLALLAYIPQRDGGLKAPRVRVRAEQREEWAAVRQAQGELEWG